MPENTSARAKRLLPDAQGAACPQQHLHAPHPTGYLAHAAWAEEMLKTHGQQQCPGCGLWAVWVPKEGR